MSILSLWKNKKSYECQFSTKLEKPRCGPIFSLLALKPKKKIFAKKNQLRHFCLFGDILTSYKKSEKNQQATPEKNFGRMN